VRAQARVELQPQALARRQQRQDGMGGGGGHHRDPALTLGVLEGAQGIPPEAAEHLEHVLVALGLGAGSLPALGGHLIDVGAGALDPVPNQELPQPLVNARILELIRQHRRHAHCQVLCDFEHRQVRPDHRIEQPLLAERIGPEPLHVGHVAVQHDRQVPDRFFGAHPRAETPELTHDRPRGSRGHGRGRSSGG
jgi:hypothetical protein